MSDFLLGTLGCHFIITFIIDVTSLHVWFELIITFLHIFIVLLSSLSLLAIQPIRYTPVVFFLHWPILGLIFPLHHSYVSHHQFILLHRLIINIICTLGTLKSMAHEIFYTCYILYMRAWVFHHRVFGPSFPSFLSPYHPSLRYVPCLKTTLRPWDQMLCSKTPT